MNDRLIGPIRAAARAKLRVNGRKTEHDAVDQYLNSPVMLRAMHRSVQSCFDGVASLVTEHQNSGYASVLQSTAS
jgi:hypothetical protein